MTGFLEFEALGLHGLSTEQQTKVAAAQAEAAAQTRLAHTSASLWLGDLDPTVQKATLYNIFSPFGAIESIDMYQDPITQRNLGFASIYFVRPPSIGPEVANCIVISGKPCRIMWDAPRTECTKRKEMCMSIKINHLDPSVTRKSLQDTFAYFGHIISCQLATDKSGGSKGYAFIKYDTAGAARRAVHKFNGLALYGAKVEVQLYQPSEPEVTVPRGKDEVKPRFAKIDMKNILKEVGEDKIFSESDMEAYSKGYGQDHLESLKDINVVPQQMNNLKYYGQAAQISRVQTNMEYGKDSQQQHGRANLDVRPIKQHAANLYVKNLSEDIDNLELSAAFSCFGTITSAKVMKDATTGVSKGFGFVCFSTPEEASRALIGMNGAVLGAKSIYVAVAQRKEFRRQQLEAQIA